MQLLARLDGAQLIGELRTSGGAAGEAWRRIIAAQERLRTSLSGDGGGGLDRRALQSLGNQLFTLLFSKPIRELYEQARRARAVELVFTSLVPWIADKPWELLRDPRRGFVAKGKVRLSRSVPSAVAAAAPAPRRGKLRVLIAAAEPRGLAPLDWEAESRAIEAGFAALQERGLLEATLVRAASLSALRDALRTQRFDVLHFVGHGGWDAARDRGYLLFEEEGEARQVSPAALVALLRDRGLRLLVLNACESGRQSRKSKRGDHESNGHEVNRGVAQALLAAGLPAVLANQYPVFDKPAASFVARLYAGLGRGEGLSESVRHARLALAREAGSGALEWAVPVLYAREPGQRLCAASPEAKRRRGRAR